MGDTGGMPPLRHRAVTRRALLAAALGVPVGVAAASSAPAVSLGLDHVAARSGRWWGTCGQLPQLLTDPDYLALVRRHTSVFVPETELKMRQLQPLRGVFTFAAADAAVEAARSWGMQVRGHTLLWGNSLPFWVASVTPAEARQVVEEHVGTVVSHFAGRVASWDVVNEVTNADGYYPSRWWQLLGPEYVEIALRAARAADPGAQLVLNEFGVEYGNGLSRRRRARVLAMLTDLVRRGVPIDALGIQCHVEHDAVRDQLDPAEFQGFLRAVGRLGLTVVLTEHDVDDRNLPGDVEARDAGVAATYRRFLEAALEVPCVEGVVSWGLSDRYSYRSGEFPRSDGSAQRPTPFDEGLRPKPAAEAIVAALHGAPARAGGGLLRVRVGG